MQSAQSASIRAITYCALTLLVLFLAGRAITAWSRMAAAEARDAAARARVKNNLAQVQKAIENYNAGAEASRSEPLRIVTWNVESGGNDPAEIAQQLVELGRYDIYALQEVHPRNSQRYADAIRDDISKSFRFLLSNTGRSDRLMIIFDSDRLELQAVSELFHHEEHRLNDWRHRSPLVAEFVDSAADVHFSFVTVHLARGNADLRTEQATGLREWAKDQQRPVIAAGDFNFDYHFPTSKGNPAFDCFCEGGVCKWLKPDELIDTNWSDSDGDGADNYSDSMLDFAFAAGEARAWKAECRVVVRSGDFPDDDRSSDHRPVAVSFTPNRIEAHD